MDAGRVEQGLQPVCGRCEAALYPSSAVVETSDARFEDQVLSSAVPVLLDVCGLRGA
ncbi:MAG: hypothetical protein U0599_28505 [Vicinamibacteria bacterium]